jgi:hypothetical protein
MNHPAFVRHRSGANCLQNKVITMKYTPLLFLAIGLGACSHERPVIPDASLPLAKQPANSSQAIELCQNIQRTDKIPVVCSFDYHNSVPALTIDFPNADLANQWMATTHQNVITPFCGHSDRARRPALVFLSIGSARLSNVYSCMTREFTGWHKSEAENDRVSF